MAISKFAAVASLFLAGAALGSTEAEAATTQRACLVDSVGVIEGRMHIKCAPLPANAYTGEIRYYAMNLSEGAAKIEAIVLLAIESKRRNKAMAISFDMEDYKSVPGCAGHNCRRLIGAAME